MDDPAAPAKPKGWPLAAISLLVVLLAGFLYVRWSKKDDGPVVVKDPPPTIAPPPTPDQPKGPVPIQTPVPPSPAAAEFDARLKEARAAIDGRKWDDAAAALEAARKLRADAPELKGLEEAIAEGRKKEEAERAEAARKADLKRKQDREWAALKEKVEKQREQNFWDGALAALDKFAQE